jgi:hypothetical protein
VRRARRAMLTELHEKCQEDFGASCETSQSTEFSSAVPLLLCFGSFFFSLRNCRISKNLSNVSSRNSV